MLVLSFSSKAQETNWPSPEVQQMYEQAKNYQSTGATKQAIVLLQQAIQLAPNIMILHRDLAQGYNVLGQYDEAYKTVEPIITQNDADEQTYYIATTALLAMGEKKKTRKTLDKGIKIFSHSGFLYHELGRYYEAEVEMEYALDSWLKGIEEDPAYHLNYYEAARMYSITKRQLWAVLYGEIFINMERQTPRSVETRKLVLEGYTKMFASIGTGDVPRFGEYKYANDDLNFEDAVMKIFMQLAPVVADGMTAENLTMLRTRFIMEWMNTYNAKFPFSLFTYQERMMRDGQFDAYNQWLFGNAENTAQFNSWQQFHPNAIPAFNSWTAQNLFYNTSADAYNSKKFSGLFSKKK